MYQCLSRIKSSTMKLTESEYSEYSKEKISSPIERVLLKQEIEKDYKLSIQNLNFQYEAHVKILENFSKFNYDKNQACHYIVSHFNKISGILEQNFVEKHGKSMIELDDYSKIMDLKERYFKYLSSLKQLADSINNFSDKIVETMSKMLRKCPKCYKIWSKLSIDGCDNTTCGNRGIEGKDVNPNARSIFKPIYTKETQDKKDEFKIIHRIEKEKDEEPSTTSRVSVKKEEISGGCGTSFNWEKDAIVLTHEELSVFKEIMPKDYIENFLKESNIRDVIKKKLQKEKLEKEKLEKEKKEREEKEKNLNSM
jgi:hypothetical protein